MPNLSLRLIASIALLLVLAASLQASAAPSWSRAASHNASVSETPLSLWSLAWRSVQSVWSKAGCSLDPYGRCLPSTLQELENGCSIDPYGHYRGSEKAGCRLDPYGHCL